jgi:hypothetical protein
MVLSLSAVDNVINTVTGFYFIYDKAIQSSKHSIDFAANKLPYYNRDHMYTLEA